MFPISFQRYRLRTNYKGNKNALFLLWIFANIRNAKLWFIKKNIKTASIKNATRHSFELVTLINVSTQPNTLVLWPFSRKNFMVWCIKMVLKLWIQFHILCSNFRFSRYFLNDSLNLISVGTFSKHFQNEHVHRVWLSI